MITQLYASLATGFFLLLTVRIFAIRGNQLFNFISYGKDDEEIVPRVVRGHGNFIEYAPLFFILLYLFFILLLVGVRRYFQFLVDSEQGHPCLHF